MFLFYIEGPVVALALLLAFVSPRLGRSWFEAAEHRFNSFAERRTLAVVFSGIVAVAARLALLPVLPIPDPGVHDEFGYLLLSDTFAHGRLTNPTNPMWVHFESFHILWQPTYTAKYYPAQGLFLAFGQAFLGHPFWGVVLSVALMCAAITWMLQSWLPARWALLGGLLAVIRIGTFSCWADGYFGGAVTAMGGALVLGALPRLKKDQRLRDAIWMGIGFALIASSRPYEGLFFGAPTALALLYWLGRKRHSDWRTAFSRAIAPVLLILVLCVAALGYYCWRVTGSPFHLPYAIYEHTYGPVPYFPWESLKPFPTYHHAVFRSYYHGYELGRYELCRTLGGFVQIQLIKLFNFWGFYLGFALGIPLIFVLGTLPYGFTMRKISAETRFLLITCGLVLVANLLPIWYQPHYSSPITCAVLALVLIAMRNIRSWRWRRKSSGLFIARSIPCVCVLLLLVRIAVAPLHWPPPGRGPGAGMITWCSTPPSIHARANILSRLRDTPGRQLVIVHYGPDHNVHREWVYNRANLNSAKVIWAHDMGAEKNEKLLSYFKARRAWIVYADDNPPRLVPYGTLLTQKSHPSQSQQ